MAREKMVTRTLTITTVEVMTVDITTATTGTDRFDIVGEHTFDTALTAVKELHVEIAPNQVFTLLGPVSIDISLMKIRMEVVKLHRSLY